MLTSIKLSAVGLCHLSPLHRKELFLVVTIVLSFLLGGGLALGQDDYEDEDEVPLFLPGLIAEYTGNQGKTFQRLDEVLSMNWGQGAPDIRVPAGNFSARWTGHLQVWTTGDYQFRMYVVGKVRLKVAGAVVLEGEQTEPGWLESEPVNIEWGEQPLEIEFEKTHTDAQISFYWQGPDFHWEPVATHSLLHQTELSPDNRFQQGRFLARALRCAACHEISDHSQPISAPALDQLGGSVSPDWLVDWLMAEPSEASTQTDEELKRRMPHFSLTRNDAEAIATALFATTVNQLELQVEPEGKSPLGKYHFLSMGCTSCHVVDELGESGLFGGGDLSRIAEKRPPGYFAAWLKDPTSLNADHRMPVFTLSEEERTHLATYLATLGGEYEPRELDATNEDVIARGKALIRQHRCQQCHRLPAAIQDSSPARIRLNIANVNWDRSCAGSQGKDRPTYGLGAKQQAALQEYFSQLPNDHVEKTNSLDGKFLMRERNCLGCHSRGSERGLEAQIQAIATAEHALNRKMANIKPPALDSIGDKLHDRVLIDAITTLRQPRRNWLSVRMPKFRFAEDEAEAIANYLIQEDRIPDPPHEEKIDVDKLALQSAGSRLVTTDGFGCTSCHQIGELKPTHTGLGVQGPNLAGIGKEVRYPWFLRWVLNPTRISPRMEMPAVKTPIRGVLESKLNHQHAAVWAVLNQEGFEPPKPNPVRVVRHRNEGAKSPAIVIHDNVEAGEHSFVKPLLVAFANRHNVLFDLESYRLAGWWIGDAARQRLRKKYWYWEAAGTPILRANQGESEIALIVDGERVLPTIDEAFPPEAIVQRRVGSSWSFDSRLTFKPEGSKPIEIGIEQSFRPSQGNQKGQMMVAFERKLQFTNIPQSAVVEINVAPGASIKVLEDGHRVLSTDEGRFAIYKTTSVEPFQQSDHSSTLQLKPDSNGIAKVALEYLTALPADQFLQDSPDATLLEQEKLHVVPGFDVTRLPLAEEITPTAFAWDRQGQLLLSTLKGRLWRATDTDGDKIEDQTTLLADGLSAPFGLATVDENGREAIDVADKTALLRFSDTNGDGQLDQTRTVASGWGHSTDYHGWITGLPRDQEGNYYAIVTNRDGPASQLRGRVMKLAKLAEPTLDGKEYGIEPLAMGLRFSLGIARNRAGDLFVTDNQGQFNPYNELNHVVEGSHFGFYNLSGLEDSKEIKSMPTSGPTVGIPHPWVRSVNGICFLETPQPLYEKGKKVFGPFEGHLLGCEATTRQLVRISLQKIDGRFSGAAYPLTIPPPRGTSALLRPLVAQVAPDGALYVGSVHDSAWGAGRNQGEIVKMQFNGKLPVGIAEMQANDRGFQLEFTGNIDRTKAKDLANYVLVSYRRVPTPVYGGPDVDRRTEQIESVEVSEDGRQVFLNLAELRRGYVYELRLRNLNKDGALFHPAEAFYSLGPLE